MFCFFFFFFSLKTSIFIHQMVALVRPTISQEGYNFSVRLTVSYNFSGTQLPCYFRLGTNRAKLPQFLLFVTWNTFQQPVLPPQSEKKNSHSLFLG
uniref:Putative secreted protein n=1 Tax=Rhipicephalus microplus TaxID=6941 RepID=A0A6M2DA02_RHIMP